MWLEAPVEESTTTPIFGEVVLALNLKPTPDVRDVSVVPKVIAPELVILILSVGEDAPSAVVLNTKRPG
jgi:hypothetical protein